MKVRDAIGDVRRLQQNIEAGLKKAGIDGLPMAVPGAIPTQIKFAHPLQGLLARIVDQAGIYREPMLLSQLQNVQRMVSQADQKVGKEAVDRFNDLLKEVQTLQSQFKQMTPAA